MEIGYIGLGNMGGALAERLQLARPLKVYDANADAVRRLVDAGATACRNAGEIAADCDIIFLCLPTSEHVRSVVFDAEFSARLTPGTIIVDQTTGNPNATRDMAAVLRERGIALIDAPVSGGWRGAQAGTIAIMVGAPDADFERIKPVLDDVTCNVFHAGDTGAGQVIKLVNNMLSGAQRLLTLEGVALAAKNGIDPTRATEILTAGGGRNVFLEKFMPRVIDGALAPGFTLGLLLKDLRLVCELGSASGVPMFLGDLTRDLYQWHVNELGGACGQRLRTCLSVRGQAITREGK
ncbi:NAD(P)-dependent oxidoreductase [Gordonia hydrophobica]|uniref:NAD(P)-dependent oxidoreductase n=1 Tax=Gordonia hydrophobica TaxID=40516 RepID=A0ABZ2U6P3_9ACTN|nr:NAD(P)-dependent oxidoreductase [Gordonia hydrophobica]MBM7365417.1 3-hydroxyisobutyrate dehydrogenase [Gordonia hydrophobica]